MANDIYTTVSNCSSSVRNRIKPTLKKHLHLFSAFSSLIFVSTDVLGAIPCIADGCQCVNFMADRYSKLTQASPTDITSSDHVANVFFDSWIFPYFISTYVLSDNIMQFTSKLFATLCTLLVVKHLTATRIIPTLIGLLIGTFTR